MLSDLATPTTLDSEQFLAAADQVNVLSSEAILIVTYNNKHEPFVVCMGDRNTRATGWLADSNSSLLCDWNIRHRLCSPESRDNGALWLVRLPALDLALAVAEERGVAVDAFLLRCTDTDGQKRRIGTPHTANGQRTRTFSALVSSSFWRQL